MAANNGACNDRQTAISILETVGAALPSATQRSALKAVADFVRLSFHDEVLKMTHEEREARILEIETHLRDCMSDEERKAKAAFYYGIPSDQDFNIVILPAGSDVMLKRDEEGAINDG